MPDIKREFAPDTPMPSRSVTKALREEVDGMADSAHDCPGIPDVCPTCLRARARFGGFEVGELQQVLAALHAAARAGLIGAGPGNLLGPLADECATELDRRLT